MTYSYPAHTFLFQPAGLQQNGLLRRSVLSTTNRSIQFSHYFAETQIRRVNQNLSHRSAEASESVDGKVGYRSPPRYLFTITPQAMRGPPGPSVVGGSGRYWSSNSCTIKALPS